MTLAASHCHALADSRHRHASGAHAPLKSLHSIPYKHVYILFWERVGRRQHTTSLSPYATAAVMDWPTCKCTACRNPVATPSVGPTRLPLANNPNVHPVQPWGTPSKIPSAHARTNPSAPIPSLNCDPELPWDNIIKDLHQRCTITHLASSF